MFLTQIFPQVFHPIIKQKLINLREIQIFLRFPPLFFGDVYHKDAIFNNRDAGKFGSAGCNRRYVTKRCQ